MAGWFIITRHDFPQDSLSIKRGTILAGLSDGIWEQVQKERIRLPSCTGGAGTGAHTCRTDTNKTGNENVLRDKVADKEIGGQR